MKKIAQLCLLLALCSFTTMECYAQPPAITWQKSFGGPNDDSGGITPTPDGGYIMGGWNLGNGGDVTGNHGGYDYWVVRIDDGGNIVWQKSYGGTLNEEGRFMNVTSDGGYILSGFSFSNNGDVTGNHGGRDAWVVKIDSAGVLQWQKMLGGSGDDR